MAEMPDQKSPASLVTLPAELTRLIVSHLAPSPDALFRGCKQDLKNANLAHRCLHEWVPEFMFRDMALHHVLVGMSSHLELFGVTPGNEQLLKYVKHICVQVPPALRWEIGSGNPFAHHLEEMTAERLCAKFRVKTPAEMTEEQRQYCTNYYHAMVEPFTDNRSWYRLLRAAESSFGRVFKLFDKLEEISVGSCEIVELPSPTITHTFVLQHGEDVEQEPSPGFIEDDCVNVSWASSIIAKEAPPQVRILKLSLANMDNYNSFATVNRLLSLVYRHSPEKRTFAKEIYLSLRGIDGTHGTEDFHGDSGSAGPVRHWRSVLSNAPNLEHLHITPDFDEDPAILSFSEGELTNTTASILEWLLSGLQLPQLRKLTLHNFRLDVDKIERALSGQWPRLENLILSNGILELNIEEIETPLGHLTDDQIGHVHGQCWIDACKAISQASASVNIKVVTPYTSTTKTYGRHRPHPKYLERLKTLANVVIETENYYDAPVYAPGDVLVPFRTNNSDAQ